MHIMTSLMPEEGKENWKKGPGCVGVGAPGSD